MAMASSSCHRRRKKPPVEEIRDWAALPGDIPFAIFLKLGPREIMRGAERACTGWRRGAVGEPALWRRIDLTTVPVGCTGRWKAMARAAVDRAAGQCEAYWGPCDRKLLLHLVERATSLKSIHLSHDDTHVVLDVRELNKLPLLEDVDISVSYFSKTASQKLFESACHACPRLTALRMSFSTNRYTDGNYYEDDIGGLDLKYEIPQMLDLRSLELLGYYLTVAGLTAILDSCPALECLNIPNGDDWISSTMEEQLTAKCATLKKWTLPCESDEEYYEDYDPEEDYESLMYDNPFYY